MSDQDKDDQYGVSPAMAVAAAVKAFNRLPLGSMERREAVKADWEQSVAEEADALA